MFFTKLRRWLCFPKRPKAEVADPVEETIVAGEPDEARLVCDALLLGCPGGSLEVSFEEAAVSVRHETANFVSRRLWVLPLRKQSTPRKSWVRTSLREDWTLYTNQPLPLELSRLLQLVADNSALYRLRFSNPDLLQLVPQLRPFSSLIGLHIDGERVQGQTLPAALFSCLAVLHLQELVLFSDLCLDLQDELLERWTSLRVLKLRAVCPSLSPQGIRLVLEEWTAGDRSLDVLSVALARSPTQETAEDVYAALHDCGSKCISSEGKKPLHVAVNRMQAKTQFRQILVTEEGADKWRIIVSVL